MTHRILDVLKTAFRSLRRSPGFSLAALLTLGVGIGANTLLFTVVNSILIQPLAYPDSERLVVLREVIPELANRYPSLPVNAGHFETWRESADSIEEAAALGRVTFNLTGRSQPRRLGAARVSWNLLSMLGAPLQLGRGFRPEEDSDGNDRVVILTDRLWRSEFQQDRRILGQAILLNGNSYEVIGVLSPKIYFPRSEQLGSMIDLGSGVDIFIPMGFSENELEPVGDHNFGVIARLRKGVSYQQATAELDTLQRTIATEMPVEMGLEIRIIPLQLQLVRDVQGPLLVLLAAVGAVLLIGCVNLANLMLARTATRRGEMALRMALGARPRWVVLNVLSESLILAVGGGIIGLLLAYSAMDILLNTVPLDLPRLSDIALDYRVVLFGVLLSLVTSLIFGLLPAFRVARIDPQRSLHTVGNRGTESRKTMGARSWLVTIEVALSTILLVVASLLAASFLELNRVDRGFVVENISTIELRASTTTYPSARDRIRFYDSILEKVSQIPSISQAALTNRLPLSGQSTVDFANVPGDSRPLLERPLANYRWISSDYFETLGVTLLQGRKFRAGDRSQAVAVISQRLARELWGERYPVGQEFWRGGGEEDGTGGSANQVIGVVSDIRSISLWEDPVSTVYLPYWEQAPTVSSLVVRSRTALPPTAELQQAIREVAPEMPVSGLVPLRQIVVGSLEMQRFQTWLVAAFAVVALVLASFGIYAVISQIVTARTREIGVRMALGAARTDILKLVVRQGMIPCLIGLLGGTAAAVLVARGMAHLLFGVGATDPRTFAMVVTVLGLVSLTACYLPARRASRFDPMRILRQ